MTHHPHEHGKPQRLNRLAFAATWHCLSGCAIGEILGMSPRTVQKHLQHIYEKLGVETRTAAVVRAMELSTGR